jgi:hypothetical protein
VAETSASPNNRAVVYRGKPIKERSMPSVSKAQNAAMWEAREGNSNLGIPESVGKEFTDAQKPGSVKKLPAHAKKISRLRKAGKISDRMHAKKTEAWSDDGIKAAAR